MARLRLIRQSRNLVGSDIVIIYVILLHVYEGSIFIISDSANGSIAMSVIRAGAFNENWLAATALLIVAALATVGQYFEIPWHLRLVCLISQLPALLVTSIAAIIAVAHESYIDHVLRSWEFISCDQASRIALPLLYGIAVQARMRTA